jgi:hypothetical protein
MKLKKIMYAVALTAASVVYAGPVQTVANAGPGSGSPTGATSKVAPMTNSATAGDASTPLRSIGTAGRGQGTGPHATPIEVSTTVSALSAGAPYIKMATNGSSVTFGTGVSVKGVAPAGSTPSSKGPAPRD